MFSEQVVEVWWYTHISYLTLARRCSPCCRQTERGFPPLDVVRRGDPVIRDRVVACDWSRQEYASPRPASFPRVPRVLASCSNKKSWELKPDCTPLEFN
jgi:hypothetical protein